MFALLPLKLGLSHVATSDQALSAKLRNLMHALYNHAMRWEFFDRNPITLVRQSAKRTRVPDVLTVEEIGKLLGELADPWRTAVYVAVTTGLRVSELLGLKWADVDFTRG